MEKNVLEPDDMVPVERKRLEFLEYMLVLQFKQQKQINRMNIWICFLSIAAGYGTVKAIEALITAIAN